MAGPTASGRLLRHLRLGTHLRVRRLSPEIGRRLRRLRLSGPSALLGHGGLLRHAGLTCPTASGRLLRHLRLGTRLRVRRLSPEIGWRLWRLWLDGPSSWNRLGHPWLYTGLLGHSRLHHAGLLGHRWLGHSRLHTGLLGPGTLWVRLLRPGRLLRHAGLHSWLPGLARPTALRWRSECHQAEQANRLPSTLRTTERLGGPLDLEAAVRTAECIHVLLLFLRPRRRADHGYMAPAHFTLRPRWPWYRPFRCRGARSSREPG